MKTYIYFVRHGDVKNPKNIWYGRLKFHGLSEKGRLETVKAANYLKDKKIDLIYSSPQLRARQSAEIIRKRLAIKKIHISKKINEVKSSLQGKPAIFLGLIGWHIFASKNNEIKGETIEDLSNRMQDFISKITRIHKGKPIAVITHGDPIMIVKAKKEGLPVKIDSIRPLDGSYIQKGGVYPLKI